jgi:lipoic acid synthetase
MAGLGETHEEVFEVMDHLLEHGCDILTIGQYLQPTKKQLEVNEFVTPEVFNQYKEVGQAKGFKYVESGPLVRSSYHAERHIF